MTADQPPLDGMPETAPPSAPIPRWLAICEVGETAFALAALLLHATAKVPGLDPPIADLFDRASHQLELTVRAEIGRLAWVDAYDKAVPIWQKVYAKAQQIAALAEEE